MSNFFSHPLENLHSFTLFFLLIFTIEGQLIRAEESPSLEELIRSTLSRQPITEEDFLLAVDYFSQLEFQNPYYAQIGGYLLTIDQNFHHHDSATLLHGSLANYFIYEKDSAFLALKHVDLQIELEKNESPDLQWSAYNLRGNIYSEIRDHASALTNYYKSADLATQSETPALRAYPLGNITDIYLEQDDLSAASKSLRKSMESSLQLDEPEKSYNLSYDFMTYATLLQRLNRPDSIEHYITLSLEHAKLSESPNELFEKYSEASELLLKINKVQLAAKYFEEGKSIHNWDGMSSSALFSYQLIEAKIAIQKKNYPLARRKLAQLSTGESKRKEMELATAWLEFYTAIGNYKRALEQTNLLREIERENHATDRLSAITNLKYHHEYEEQKAISAAESKQLNSQVKARNYLLTGVGTVLGLLTILLYMTYRNFRSKKSAEKNLKEINAELQKYIDTNLQLENFAYLASHDLKSPLQNVENFTNLLSASSSTNFTEDQLLFLKYIKQGTARMREFIEDLLTYSLASNKEIMTESVDLRKLLRNVVYDSDSIIEETGAQIKIAEIPSQVKADPILLRQIFQNLLTNALKFTKPGQIPKVEIGYAKDQQMHIFSVKDNGIGIPQEAQAQIFGIFKRLHLQEEFDGTGIGLSTCKKAAEKHGGKIWVDSVKDIGSTFFFSIPKVALS